MFSEESRICIYRARTDSHSECEGKHRELFIISPILHHQESTAVAGLEWTVQYEFVTVAKDGPTTSDNNDELSCDREFRSDHAGGTNEAA